MEQKIAFCQGLAISPHYGLAIGMRETDISCPVALAALGFMPMLVYFIEAMTYAGMYSQISAEAVITEAQIDK